jgi:hypothetical protein
VNMVQSQAIHQVITADTAKLHGRPQEHCRDRRVTVTTFR